MFTESGANNGVRFSVAALRTVRTWQAVPLVRGNPLLDVRVEAEESSAVVITNLWCDKTLVARLECEGCNTFQVRPYRWISVDDLT
jgi:hypothetical protein